MMKLIKIQSCIRSFMFLFIFLTVAASPLKFLRQSILSKMQQTIQTLIYNARGRGESSHVFAYSLLHIAYNKTTLDEFYESYKLPFLRHMIGNPYPYQGPATAP